MFAFLGIADERVGWPVILLGSILAIFGLFLLIRALQLPRVTDDCK